MDKVRPYLLLAALNGFVVVLLGAFGAHGLQSLLSAEALSTWETAVRYHMFHAGAFIAPAVLATQHYHPRLRVIAALFQGGILLFSGSLYLLALSGVSALGFITPIGGLAFLAGWALLVFALLGGSRP